MWCCDGTGAISASNHLHRLRQNPFHHPLRTLSGYHPSALVSSLQRPNLWPLLWAQHLCLPTKVQVRTRSASVRVENFFYSIKVKHFHIHTANVLTWVGTLSFEGQKLCSAWLSRLIYCKNGVKNESMKTHSVRRWGKQRQYSWTFMVRDGQKNKCSVKEMVWFLLGWHVNLSESALTSDRRRPIKGIGGPSPWVQFLSLSPLDAGFNLPHEGPNDTSRGNYGLLLVGCLWGGGKLLRDGVQLWDAGSRPISDNKVKASGACSAILSVNKWGFYCKWLHSSSDDFMARNSQSPTS